MSRSTSMQLKSFMLVWPVLKRTTDGSALMCTTNRIHTPWPTIYKNEDLGLGPLILPASDACYSRHPMPSPCRAKRERNSKFPSRCCQPLSMAKCVFLCKSSAPSSSSVRKRLRQGATETQAVAYRSLSCLALHTNSAPTAWPRRLTRSQ